MPFPASFFFHNDYNLSMTGFELPISSVKSNHYTNCAPTTGQAVFTCLCSNWKMPFQQRKTVFNIVPCNDSTCRLPLNKIRFRFREKRIWKRGKKGCLCCCWCGSPPTTSDPSESIISESLGEYFELLQILSLCLNPWTTFSIFLSVCLPLFVRKPVSEVF